MFAQILLNIRVFCDNILHIFSFFQRYTLIFSNLFIFRVYLGFCCDYHCLTRLIIVKIQSVFIRNFTFE